MAVITIKNLHSEGGYGHGNLGLPMFLQEDSLAFDVLTMDGKKATAAGTIPVYGVLAGDTGNWNSQYGTFKGGLNMYGSANSTVRGIPKGWAEVDVEKAPGTLVYLADDGKLADTGTRKFGIYFADKNATASKSIWFDNSLNF